MDSPGQFLDSVPHSRLRDGHRGIGIKTLRLTYRRIVFASFLAALLGVLPLASGSLPAAAVVPPPRGALADLYQKTVTDIVDGLERNGFEGYGTLGQVQIPIAQLRGRLARVHYVEVDRFDKPTGATRFTAFNAPSTETVYINRAARHYAGFVQPLAFHEALGAIGIRDFYYEVSIGSWLLSQSPTDREPLAEHAKRRRGMLELSLAQSYREAQDLKLSPEALRDPNRHLKLAEGGEGGANVVGGGGDEDALRFKLALLNLFDQDQSLRYPWVYTVMLLPVQIEMTEDPAVTSIVYDQVQVGTSPDGRGLFQTFPKLLVPKALATVVLHDGDITKDLAIRQVRRFLADWFQVPGPGDVSFSCRGWASDWYRPLANIQADAYRLQKDQWDARLKRFEECRR